MVSATDDGGGGGELNERQLGTSLVVLESDSAHAENGANLWPLVILCVVMGKRQECRSSAALLFCSVPISTLNSLQMSTFELQPLQQLPEYFPRHSSKS